MTAKNLQLVEEPKRTMSVNPRKFILWLFIATIVMLFAALTSAYIVRQSEGNWLDFELPSIFWISTIIVILSSATMHWAHLSAKKDELGQVRTGMIATSLLGLGFLISQYIGWSALVAMDVYFVGNPAGSFLYVITGLHGAHIVAGIVVLMVVLRATFNYKIHSRNMTTMEIGATFWHFLGGLWVYLFIFLLLNR